jgi:hypothetical protein
MNKDFEQDLRGFVEAAVAYCNAIRNGQSKKANRQVGVATNAYRKLKERGEVAKTAFLELLGSEDEAIRYMAAVHALDFAPEQGERVLANIAKGPRVPTA